MLAKDLIVGIAAAISAASGIVTIASALARGSFLHAYSRRGRALFGVALLAIGGIAGMSTVQEGTEPAPSVSRSPADAHFASTAPSTAVPTTALSRAGAATAKPLPAAVPGAPRMRIRIRDTEHRLVPELVATAQRAISDDVTLEGSLRTTTTAPDEHLQGLISAYMTLTITLTDNGGRLRDAFTLQAKGGGFTTDAAMLQARERLQTALTDRLHARP